MTQDRPPKPPARTDTRRATEMDARIGQLIRERRQALGLRLEDLANLLRIAPHQLQKYETGGNRIPASRLVECARALSTPVAWFYHSEKSALQDVQQTSGLSAEEWALVEAYRKLGARGREHLANIAQMLNASDDKRPA